MCPLIFIFLTLRMSFCCSLEGTFELLRDEHQALHLAYTSLEEKHRKLNLENQDVLKRFFEVKEQHANLMNQENENFVK